MTVNLHKRPPPPPQKGKQNCASDVSIQYFKSEGGGGEFIRNAAEMFSFGPDPTRAKICLVLF